MAESAFNMFDALSSWGTSLPTWQHLLLSKLVGKVELSDEDLDQVFEEYLIDQNLAGPGATRTAWDMKLPQFKLSESRISSTLRAMTSLSGVNALAPNQTLSFGPQLTVIYGPNGAGKSGYARVLKSACFTRSKETVILGDVKIEKAKQPTPSATFGFDDGSAVEYIYPQPCQRLRDNFAVFDSTCVEVHLDARNSFRVMPYLFDVFPRMVAAFGKMQEKLRDEITKREPAADQFAIEGSTSEVASLLSALTPKTNLVKLQKFAVFGEVEAARLFAIDTRLVELRTNDPAEIIKRNEQRILDLNSLTASIGALAKAVTPDLVKSIDETTTQIIALAEQGAALSAAQLGGEPVQPVGTPAWQSLLAAAIAYNEEAFPGETFPPSTEDARCLLCHQVLDGESTDRLARFYRTATSDVETRLTTARRTLKGFSATLRSVPLAFFNADSASCTPR